MDQQVTEMTKVCQIILKIDERANTYADVIPHWEQLMIEVVIVEGGHTQYQEFVWLTNEWAPAKWRLIRHELEKRVAQTNVVRKVA